MKTFALVVASVLVACGLFVAKAVGDSSLRGTIPEQSEVSDWRSLSVCHVCMFDAY